MNQNQNQTLFAILCDYHWNVLRERPEGAMGDTSTPSRAYAAEIFEKLGIELVSPGEGFFEELVAVGREAGRDREVKDVEAFAREWAAFYIERIDLDQAFEDALDDAQAQKEQEEKEDK